MSKVTVSDFILALSDLIEAQSKELQKEWSAFFDVQRKKFQLTFASLAFFIVFAFLIIFGIVSFAYASFLLLKIFMPSFVAMYVISAFFFIVAYFVVKRTKNG